jgi:hypothetical protein
MDFFKGLFCKEEPVPQWADFFSLSEYHDFISLVEEYFQGQGEKIVIQDGIVRFLNSGGTWASTQQCGLMNLAQVCHQNSKREWRQLIFQHFESFRETMRDAEAFDEKVKNFYSIYDLLAVRLWPESHLQEIGENKFVFRRDMDGVITVLAFDLPRIVKQVLPEEAAHWNKPVEELFEIGLANVRKKPRPEIMKVALDDLNTVYLFSGDSFFVASYALLLKYHPTCVGTYGALLGVPTRHTMLCYPIHCGDAIKIAPQLVAMLNGVYNEGPGSLSPYLYWYRDQQFTSFLYEIVDQKLSVNPPETLVELLKNVPPEE